jgi:hypothetical protein
MDASDLELVGKEKQGVLKRCRDLFDSWGRTLPDVPACPFHSRMLYAGYYKRQYL